MSVVDIDNRPQDSDWCVADIFDALAIKKSQISVSAELIINIFSNSIKCQIKFESLLLMVTMFFQIVIF